MGIKKYNPTTPGLRGMTVSTFEEITTSTPEKSLTVTLKKHSGRNNRGKITVRHKGGGTRPKYRIIDFKRDKDGIPAIVKTRNSYSNRIRSEQKCKHRAAGLRRRRKEIYSGSEQAEDRIHHRIRTGRRYHGWKRTANREHSGWYHHPQCGIKAWQGRPAGSFRR